MFNVLLFATKLLAVESYISTLFNVLLSIVILFAVESLNSEFVIITSSSVPVYAIIVLASMSAYNVANIVELLKPTIDVIGGSVG